MGITGLTSYMQENSKLYMQSFELKNTYLVIDGNCISSQLCLSTGNSIFGGDYHEYAKKVSRFFDQLLKCKITPLVLMDGGSEEKKLSTSFMRLKSDVNREIKYSGSKTRHLFPMFKYKVFMEVMQSKNIRFAQCKFEADHEIAAIAKQLNVPVLSFDSDFFIFGVSYIPFNTLRYSGNKIACKIYHVQKLLGHFGSLSVSQLALAATLLGNDYKKISVKNAFERIQLPQVTCKGNVKQKRIVGTLTWLSKHTFSSAISEILNKAPQTSRNKLFDSIRESVSVYTNMESDMWIPLGFTTDFRAKMNCKVKTNKDAFKSNLSKALCKEVQIEDNSRVDNNAEIFGNLPRWFKKEFYSGRIHTSFLSMMTCRVFTFKPQIEDYSLTTSGFTSRKIAALIYKIASSRICDKDKDSAELWAREGSTLTKSTVNVSEFNATKDAPSLFDLTKLSASSKKQIFDECLEVGQRDLLHEIPEEWRLFFAAMKFWRMKGRDSVVNLNHCYSLILCLLYSLSIKEFGHLSLQTLESRYSKILGNKRGIKIYGKNKLNATIDQISKQVTFKEKIISAPFFAAKLKTDPKLQKNPNLFDVSIVHAFSMFQSCLSDSINLNAILQCPYEPTIVSETLNGTLLYNLYNCLCEQNDAKAYIVNQVFKQTPNLARLFNLIAEKFEGIFIGRTQVKPKRKRNRQKKKPVVRVNDPFSLDPLVISLASYGYLPRAQQELFTYEFLRSAGSLLIN